MNLSLGDFNCTAQQNVQELKEGSKRKWHVIRVASQSSMENKTINKWY